MKSNGMGRGKKRPGNIHIHWFSPRRSGKSFYTKMTDFDPEKALEAGTAENAALLYDMDHG